MKKATAILLVIIMCVLSACTNGNKEGVEMTSDININQLGYYPNDSKIAVLRGDNISDEFSVVDADTGEVVYSGALSDAVYNASADETNRLADFSLLDTAGRYYIKNESLGSSCTFEIGNGVYDESFNKIIKMFYYQRCGERLSLRYAGKFRHPACHTDEAVVYETGESIDVSGGWHDAGDYGRYVVAGAKAAVDLMLAYNRNPEKFKDNVGIPESGNGLPDILDEVRYELEWMLKMQRVDGGVYHKVTGKSFPDAVMPHKERDMIVSPVSSTATADFAGAMAVAYMTYRDIESEFANACLKSAERAWEYLEQNKELVYNNIAEITTGEYGDSSDTDERYFAAAALFAATRESVYFDTAEKLLRRDFSQELGWQSVGAYGTYILLKSGMPENDTYDYALKLLTDEVNRLVAIANDDGYSISLDENGYVWGSNMNVANNAMLMLMLNDIRPENEYRRVAKMHMDYLLGRNPMGMSYVSQTGSVSPEHPHHRPSIYKNKPVPGMLAGGPDSRLEDDCAKQELIGRAPAKCYIDNDASYSTNETAIYWNSPLVFLMSEYV